MVMSAAQATVLTTASTALQAASQLQKEIGLVEARIATAAGLQHSRILYNGLIVGNPIGDPQDDANVTDVQEDFRDALISAGYYIGFDESTGYWLISWEGIGAEGLVNLYSIRTTLTPGGISVQTIALVNAYFATLSPPVRSKTVAVSITGGNIDETAYGGIASTGYEYVVVTQQPDITVNFSAGILAALLASGLGYNTSGTDNVEVYKLI